MKVVAVDLDSVLGDTRPLWHAWLESASHVLELGGLPEDRLAAAVELDARAGNWRVLLRRFAEDHAAVYLRRDGSVNATLRRLKSEGARIVAVTDAPVELVEVALAQLGAARYVDEVVTDAEAVVRSRAALSAV